MTWTDMPPSSWLPTQATEYSLTALDDGRVLLAGGIWSTPSNTVMPTAMTFSTQTGATVSVDGRVRGKLPLARPVRATSGLRTVVRVHLEGYVPFVQTVEVSASRSATVSTKMEVLARAGRLRVKEAKGREAMVVGDGVVVGEARSSSPCQLAPWARGGFEVIDNLDLWIGAGGLLLVLGDRPTWWYEENVPAGADGAAQLLIRTRVDRIAAAGRSGRARRERRDPRPPGGRWPDHLRRPSSQPRRHEARLISHAPSRVASVPAARAQPRQVLSQSSKQKESVVGSGRTKTSTFCVRSMGAASSRASADGGAGSATFCACSSGGAALGEAQPRTTTIHQGRAARRRSIMRPAAYGIMLRGASRIHSAHALRNGSTSPITARSAAS
jgi:hypothetical protein